MGLTDALLADSEAKRGRTGVWRGRLSRDAALLLNTATQDGPAIATPARLGIVPECLAALWQAAPEHGRARPNPPSVRSGLRWPRPVLATSPRRYSARRRRE